MELNKRYYNHKGVDLKSSDLTRPPEYATYMRNIQYTNEGGINKRSGKQAHAASAGGYGTWTYRRLVPTTGAQAYEVVTVDQNLFKLSTTTLNVTYGGSGTSATISIFLDTSGSSNEYRCQILEDTVLVLDTDLDIGFDELSSKTVSDLATLINAITGYTATVTGDGTVPAAFLKITREYELKNTPFSQVAKYWTQVNSTVTNPLANYYANRYESDHENVSAHQMQNCIYFASGFDALMKYDGQTFYRAGLPTPNAPTVALAAGAVTGTTYFHKAQFIQYDAAGNIIEGNHTNTATSVSPAGQSMNVTVQNAVAGTGYNTNCAVVNGNQVGVTTITVVNGHTLQVGDTAYFLDRSSGNYVTREVTARANTTITISGAAVNVNNSDVISNNLRIAIWRTKTGGTAASNFYLVAEIPNNSFAATQVYNDNKADAALGELFLVPATDRSPPPMGRYVSSWQNVMAIGGIPTLKNVLAYSDSDNPEYFPADSNQLLIDPGNGDIITGICPSNEVFTVHGEVTFTVISGELASGQVRVETKALDVGCSAHATLNDVDGVLMWLSPKGPRYSLGGQVPRPLGPALDQNEGNQASRIDPAFNNDGKSEEQKVRMKRALSFVDSKNDFLLIFVPCENGDDTLRYPNTNSLVFVYDKVRDAWLIWDSYNFAGGMTSLDEEVYIVERRYSTYETSVQSIMYRRNNLVDAYDYADNTSAIAIDYAPQWEAQGEPSVLKDALKIKIFSLESVANNQFTVTVDEEINYQTDVSVASFDVPFTGGGYGNMRYDIDPYGDPSQDGIIRPLGRVRMKSMRPRFSNDTIHENVLITGWEIEFSSPYDTELKT